MNIVITIYCLVDNVNECNRGVAVIEYIVILFKPPVMEFVV